MQVIDKLLDLLLEVYAEDASQQMPLEEFKGLIVFNIGGDRITLKTYVSFARQFRFFNTTGNGVIEFDWETIAKAVERRLLKLKNAQQIARYKAFLKAVRAK